MIRHIHDKKVDLERLTLKELNDLFRHSISVGAELPSRQPDGEWIRDNYLIREEMKRRLKK